MLVKRGCFKVLINDCVWLEAFVLQLSTLSFRFVKGTIYKKKLCWPPPSLDLSPLCRSRMGLASCEDGRHIVLALILVFYSNLGEFFFCVCLPNSTFCSLRPFHLQELQTLISNFRYKENSCQRKLSQIGRMMSDKETRKRTNEKKEWSSWTRREIKRVPTLFSPRTGQVWTNLTVESEGWHSEDVCRHAQGDWAGTPPNLFVELRLTICSGTIMRETQQLQNRKRQKHVRVAGLWWIVSKVCSGTLSLFTACTEEYFLSLITFLILGRWNHGWWLWHFLLSGTLETAAFISKSKKI